MRLMAETPQVARVRAAGGAVLTALSENGLDENPAIAIKALAIVLGCLAAATENPSEVLKAAVKIARDITDGNDTMGSA
jgi:hypothetical protein